MLTSAAYPLMPHKFGAQAPCEAACSLRRC